MSVTERPKSFLLEEVEQLCAYCDEVFVTARCNTGYGLPCCEECHDGFEMAAELRRNGDL